mmetsp:Transcript_25281/g.73159  ORF Transcript_25281/g.73159 Transcript_25281/m.73159 type:complete len:215 (+) Transcript_25281:1467-2111(+)
MSSSRSSCSCSCSIVFSPLPSRRPAGPAAGGCRRRRRLPAPDTITIGAAPTTAMRSDGTMPSPSWPTRPRGGRMGTRPLRGSGSCSGSRMGSTPCRDMVPDGRWSNPLAIPVSPPTASVVMAAAAAAMACLSNSSSHNNSNNSSHNNNNRLPRRQWPWRPTPAPRPRALWRPTSSNRRRSLAKASRQQVEQAEQADRQEPTALPPRTTITAGMP